MKRIRGTLLLVSLIVVAAAALMLPTSAIAGWTWDDPVEAPPAVDITG
jgi:hypothetical protein